jgi:hypothetical protein
MSYFWFQKAGGSREWHEALGDQREKLVASGKVAFVTVLDCLSVPDKEMGREEFAKLRYTGPLYFDWDAADIAEVIPPFQEFIRKLEQEGVKTSAMRLYASGGKGFHIEIPESMVNPKPSKTGTLLLPYVYRDMANELATDKMDMRVYTARMGRMWRAPGVERMNKDGEPTGRYKVSITLDQAMSMTPELYVTLTSSPTPEVPREAPELSAFLSVMFVKFKEKIEKQTKERAKFKADEKLLEKYSGQFPPTVERIMRGEGLKPGAGFQKIAMQLGITANALGKSEDDLIAMCEGLVQNHQSDGDRYNTPRKRKDELRRMWKYTQGDEVYGYSAGAIKSLLAVGETTPDLNHPSQNAAAGMVQDEDSTELPPELAQEFDGAGSGFLDGLVLLKTGIWRRTTEGPKQLSSTAFSRPTKMIDSEDGLHLGFEVGISTDEVPQGRHLVQIPVFKSRATLNDFVSGRGGAYTGSDTQAALIQLILSRKALKEGKMTYIVRKEGLDIVQDPTSLSDIRRHVLWVSSDPDGVLGYTDGVVYRYAAKVSQSPIFSTDLHRATEIENTEASRKWVAALLTVNSPTTVALMLGWFVSCFHKQFYQVAYNQFPLLHPNGTAGSGKTKTTELLNRMFYVTSIPKMFQSSHNASSSFSLKAAWTASASIPVILDEYKPAELGPTRYDFLLQHFRLLYNQGAGASGGISRGGAESSFRDVTQYTYSAPTVYLGESQEMQTAIVQRSIPVGFQQSDSSKHTASYDFAAAEINRHMPAQLGALLMRRSLLETVRSRSEALDPVRSRLRATMDRSVHDRQVYNLAVVICGLEFLGEALSTVFGTEFDQAISGLRASVFEFKDELNTYAMAESSKVLSEMATISRTEDVDSEFSMREGYEYLVGDGYVELLVKEAFIKYFAWCNRKGFKPLYTTADGFTNSLSKSPVVMDLRCFDSKLRSGGVSKVFRLSLEKLKEEGVEMFKSKSLG